MRFSSTPRKIPVEAPANLAGQPGVVATACAALALAGLALSACAGPQEGVFRGEALYAGCAQCHGADGSGNEGIGAPPIAGLPEWYVHSQLLKFKSGARGAHPEDVHGQKMRFMTLPLRTPGDFASVAAYVGQMPRPRLTPTLDGDPEKGKLSFATCMACHGADGKGNEALNAPPIVGSADWYLLTTLKKFKAGYRGGDPKDITGSQMRPMATTLADEQAMKDVIAYIGTLKGGQ